MATPTDRDERTVGRVVKAHGLAGELVVDPSTDHVAQRFAAGSVLRVRPPRRPVPTTVGALPQQLTVTGARRHGERLLVTVSEVTDRDTAEALRQSSLTAPPSDDVPADPEEFEDHQLEGLGVELADGTRIGRVRQVLHGAGGELLVVDRESDADGAGGGELLVPFVLAIVPEVDVAGGRLVLDPPEGLLDPA